LNVGADFDRQGFSRVPRTPTRKKSCRGTCSPHAAEPKKILSHADGGGVFLAGSPAVSDSPQALAVIDGSLIQLTRKGAAAGLLAPLATGVLEFRRGPLCTYVREHPYGLLPGLPNLYCIDASLRLQWMAEWPESAGPCTEILEVAGEKLVAAAASGAVVTLDALNGRLLSVEYPQAATA
jgi:hypothetical protein